MGGLQVQFSVIRSRSCALFTCVFLGLCTGCSVTPALHEVVNQNTANTRAYAANVSLLADAARSLVHQQTAASVQRARESLAARLIQVRMSITPEHPADSDLADPAASWSTSLRGEIDRLQTRLNAAPPGQRGDIAAGLAPDNPAIIDAAIATPGFDATRVLHDARDLDVLNQQIQREPSPDLRAALHTRRNALLDPYYSICLARRSADRRTRALDDFIAALDEQGRILGLHAAAIGRASDSSPPSGTLASVYHDQQLRAAVLDLIVPTSGDRAATAVRDRMARMDALVDDSHAAPAP